MTIPVRSELTIRIQLPILFAHLSSLPDYQVWPFSFPNDGRLYSLTIFFEQNVLNPYQPILLLL